MIEIVTFEVFVFTDTAKLTMLSSILFLVLPDRTLPENILTLLLGWYDIVTSDQRWNNVVYVIVEIYNYVEQRGINVVQTY